MPVFLILFGHGVRVQPVERAHGGDRAVGRNEGLQRVRAGLDEQLRRGVQEHAEERESEAEEIHEASLSWSAELC